MRIPAVTADPQWFYYRVNGVLQSVAKALNPRLLTCCLRGCWCRSWLTGPHPHLALCFFPPEQEEGFVCRMLKHLSIHRETEGTNWLLCTLQEALHLKSCFCRLKQTQSFFLDLLIPSTLTCFRRKLQEWAAAEGESVTSHLCRLEWIIYVWLCNGCVCHLAAFCHATGSAVDWMCRIYWYSTLHTEALGRRNCSHPELWPLCPSLTHSVMELFVSLCPLYKLRGDQFGLWSSRNVQDVLWQRSHMWKARARRMVLCDQ